MYQLVDNPAAPFLTLAGDTKGPCVNVGVATVHGAPIYVGEPELRSIMKEFGWPSPEAHADLQAERDAAVQQADVLAGKLDEACRRLDAFEVLLKQPEPAETV